MGIVGEFFDGELRGYRAIERRERAIARKVIAQHGELVILWTKLLDQYAIGAEGTQAIDIPDENDRIARIVRAQFFVLAAGHSKAALHATVAGNYHHACFSLRYMCELLLQAMYVRFRPMEARRWYSALAQPYTASHPPKLDTAFKRVLPEFEHPITKGFIQTIHDIAKKMDELGAHPSQETLLQTISSDEELARIGTRYDRETSIATLDSGLLLTLLLVDEMDHSIPDEVWRAEVDPLWAERREKMRSYWASHDSVGDENIDLEHADQ